MSEPKEVQGNAAMEELAALGEWLTNERFMVQHRVENLLIGAIFCLDKRLKDLEESSAPFAPPGRGEVPVEVLEAIRNVARAYDDDTGNWTKIRGWLISEGIDCDYFGPAPAPKAASQGVLKAIDTLEYFMRGLYKPPTEALATLRRHLGLEA